MKRNSLLLILLTVLFMGANAQNTLEIEGVFKGVTNATVKVLDNSYQEIGKTTFNNGKFNLSVEVKEIELGSIMVLQDEKLILRDEIILEKGKIQIGLLTPGSAMIKGGKYNKILIEKLRTAEYRKKKNKLMDITSGQGTLDGLIDKNDEPLGVELFLGIHNLATDYYNHVIETSTDNRAILFAAYMSNLQPNRERTMTYVDKAAKTIGEDDKMVKAIRQMNKSQESTVKGRIGKQVGEMYTDFKAKTIDGKDFQLKPVVESNKYTLLQFWASWCGPCRKEIPLLKELNKEYKKDGFAIVSFSMDQNKACWERATQKENFNWANVSDLKAFKSEIASKYPLIGIPANVIINQKGEIVASNLIDEDLEETVKKLMGEKH